MSDGTFRSATYVANGSGGKPHVLMATITGRSYQNAFADTREQATVTALAQGYTVTGAQIGCCLIQDARNLAVGQLKKTDPPAEFLLFLDDDMLLPHDVVDRLVSVAEHFRADIVGVLCTMRGYPATVIGLGLDGKKFTARQALDYHRDKMVVESSMVGGGVMLIRASIFDKLEAPYFSFEKGLGEDFGFCKSVRAVGGKIVCDFALESQLNGRTYPGVAHLGIYPYSLLDCEVR